MVDVRVVRRKAQRALEARLGLARLAHFLEAVKRPATGAVGDVARELAAGGRDLVAPRLARRDREPCALQHFGKAPDALRIRAVELRARKRVERYEVELGAHALRDAQELARL